MERMKSLPLFAAFMLGFAALLAGCSSAVRPDSVTVSVADLKPADASATETRIIVTLRFTSESLNAFGFLGSTHKLYLNGGYVGKAVSSKALGLPPLSTATQDVTMVLENAALVRQLLSAGGEPVVRYRLESVLHTKSGDDEMRVKSKYEGSIDLRHLQGTNP
jgi:LEA14-like dessication related protein